MDAALIGVIGTLIGGFLGSWLTYRNSTALAKLEMKWQQVRLSQEKLEEIAVIIDQIDQHYKKLMGDVISKIEYNKPLEFTGERIPFERLRILMEFYAPAMLNDWSKLKSARDLFGEVLVEAIPSIDRTKPEKQTLNTRVFTAQNKVSEVCRSLSEKAALLARDTVGASYLQR